MQLQVPFVQLPLHFDARTLKAEAGAISQDAWREHPQKYPGNYALPLIAVDGDPDSDEIAGPMRATGHLQRCPYLQRVLARLGAVWGRTRLMKLAPGAEVTPHADINYYWRDRVRVHVPIATGPEVRFICGDAEVNMAAGECWIFDTWRPHRVLNPTPRDRIHLVADTVGGDLFWSLVEHGRAPGHGVPGNWQTSDFPCDSAHDAAPNLVFESM
ncbi:MAG: aspartyl/asparaginyl beta-hydroxylase domain-containing protein, partial [Rhodanobacteraceae bacterium]